jgi:ribulose-phosphate 3-epimerase
MVDAPEQYFEELAAAGLNTVSFHIEAVDDPTPVIGKAKGAGMRAGLVLSPETPAEAALPFLDELDDVMVMAVHPGWGGQRFIPEALDKTEFLRAELDRRGSPADLQVDGGVKRDNARRVLEAGASVLIAGSAIFSEPDPAEAARQLAELARGA